MTDRHAVPDEGTNWLDELVADLITSLFLGDRSKDRCATDDDGDWVCGYMGPWPDTRSDDGRGLD